MPFEDEIETFTVEFDENKGYVHSMEVMRYKEADSSNKRSGQTKHWNGERSMTWEENGKLWAIFTVEEIPYNISTEFSITE